MAEDTTVENISSSQDLHQESDCVEYQDTQVKMKAVRLSGHSTEIAAKHRRGPKWWQFRYSRKKVSIIYSTLSV
jgi:hypothetical protein